VVPDVSMSLAGFITGPNGPPHGCLPGAPAQAGALSRAGTAKIQ
jgi:hypothetical protein